MYARIRSVLVCVCVRNNKLIISKMLGKWKPGLCDHNNVDFRNVNKYISPSIPTIDYEIICLSIAQAYVITTEIEGNIV